MQAAGEHACPRCGVLVGNRPYDVRESPIKDVPVGHRPLVVVWRQRRYRCAEAAARSGSSSSSRSRSVRGGGSRSG